MVRKGLYGGVAVIEQPRAQSSDSGESPASVRVLMIEDDPFYFKFVRHLLNRFRRAKFEVLHADSLEAASLLLSSEVFDVILLDLGLPDGGGLPNLTRVREMSDRVPIVILTASDDEQIGLDAVASGAQDFLVKQNISNDALIRCLLYAIERRKSADSMLRWSAIRDFTATLAHDLQVPLVGSRNVLGAIVGGQFGELSPGLAPVISLLHDSSKSQLSLVQKLLEIYRYEVGSLDLPIVNVDLKLLMLKVTAELSDTKSDTAPVNIAWPDNFPPVEGNAEALHIMFLNLLDNALKYGDGPVEVNAEVAGDKVVVNVYNSGAAIPQDMQNHLFHRFAQGIPGKSYRAHVGLGLYLCHRIVSLHHGRITCRSAPESGTTVTVRLPVARN